MKNLPSCKKLNLGLSDGWLTIQLNSPENRNALSAEMARELESTLLSVRDDRTIRGITFRGAGGNFCAGGDIKAFMDALEPGSASFDAISDLNRKGGELFALVSSMPQVVLALIDGAAIAGGLGLACCADFIGVTRAAKFGLSETQLGITPAQIAPFVVSRIGLINAKRLMLTGARFDGREALTLGLADSFAEDAAGLDQFEQEIRASVKKCAPGANAITKEILAATQILPPDEMVAFAAHGFATCLMSAEGREGISAFIMKRKPAWAD
jgi:isohexenylglutaconyl-CoA hydratase